MANRHLRKYMTEFIGNSGTFGAIAEAYGNTEIGDVFFRLWKALEKDYFVVEFMIGNIYSGLEDYTISYHFFETIKSLTKFLRSLSEYKYGYGKIDSTVEDFIDQINQGMRLNYAIAKGV